MMKQRTDMRGAPRRNMSAEEQSRKDLAALQDRDEVMQKALSINPDGDYAGKDVRGILEILFEGDPKVKEIATERLRGRLDMAMEGNGRLETYASNGQSDSGLPESLDTGGSLALALRRLSNNRN